MLELDQAGSCAVNIFYIVSWGKGENQKFPSKIEFVQNTLSKICLNKVLDKMYLNK